MHVEVAVDRLKRRFGVEVELHQPRVPYLETIRNESRAQGRYKKQTGGRGQFGDCHIVLEPIEGGDRLRVRRQDRRRRDPAELPARRSTRASRRRCSTASSPARRSRASACCSSTARTTTSTPRRWRSRSPARWPSRTAYEKASPVLLEPIMELEVTVPDDAVGAVNGDLNSRRGRLHGMEPAAGMTTIKAEVPMAEILTYSQSLTSLTGGRGDYHMQFLRYEEVPAHIAQKIIDETKKAREAEKASAQPAEKTPGIAYSRERRGTMRTMEASSARSASARSCSASSRSGSRRTARRLRRRLPALPGGRARPRAGSARAARSAPAVRNVRRRRSLSLAAILGVGGAARPRRSSPSRSSAGSPTDEQAVVEAAGAVQRERGPRTVEGIARSLGEPQVSVVPLSGSSTDVVITVSWEISWYQYRVTAEATQPVRLAERGHGAGRARSDLHGLERAARVGSRDRPGARGSGRPRRARPGGVDADRGVRTMRMRVTVR